jgi:pimeloyl-ACP methyl ester carboxylesterase
MSMQDSEHSTIEANGLHFAYKAWGDPASPQRFLAFHGWQDNAATFDRLLPHLHGVHVIAVDMAGHGKSQHRQDGMTYGILDYVRDAIAIADAVQWDQFGVIGHSLGGAVASITAGAFPERVTRCILIDSAGPQATEAEDLPGLVRQCVADHKRYTANNRPTYATFQQMVAMRCKINGLSEAAAEILCARMVEPCAEGYRWRWDPRLRAASLFRLSEQAVHAFFKGITAPSLAISAQGGLLALYPRQSTRFGCIAKLEVVDLPGGHFLHLEEQAPLVAQAINDWLNKQV